MRKKVSEKCIVCGGKYSSRGYCNKHRIQIQRHKKILERTRFDPNEIIDCGEYCEIILYNGQKAGEESKEIARAKIDKKDLKKIKGYKWCLNNHDGCVVARINKKVVRLQHLIVGKPLKGYDVDHRYGDTLDNRKSELRIITHQQNGMNRTKINKNNTSGITGVVWDKFRNKWIARILANNKNINLGGFINKQNAIKARQKAEQKYFGEYAYKNNNY